MSVILFDFLFLSGLIQIGFWAHITAENKA